MYAFQQRFTFVKPSLICVDELSDPNLDMQKEEGGFRGTLLTSTISHQAVSEACLN